LGEDSLFDVGGLSDVGLNGRENVPDALLYFETPSMLMGARWGSTTVDVMYVCDNAGPLMGTKTLQHESISRPRKIETYRSLT
jgi:hypothetical protein